MRVTMLTKLAILMILGLSLTLGRKPSLEACQFEIKLVDADTAEPLAARMHLRNAK